MSRTGLDALIRSLLSKVPGRKLNKTQLIKLVFLCDYEHYETFGKTISDLTYYCAELGPVAWDIPDRAAAMHDVEHEYHAPGLLHPYPEHTYTLAVCASGTALSVQEEATVARAVRNWGGRSAKQLVAIVHSEPFARLLTEGAPIDFSRLDDDPLADAHVQDAVMSDPELQESVARAERQLRTRHETAP